ncbi:protease complex subunit PrcB family protein [Flavobacterium sp. RHBU_24]|uniref:protease complex subunit PrcB family protein n=1 Tax=Flavobacterium sp. RHBU_24 TaxID=3391185 RepID=UPI003984D986
MKKIVLFAALAFAATGCQDDGANTLTTDPVAIEFSQVGKSDLYGNGAENIEGGNLVINADADWQALLTQMAAVNPLPEGFNADVDFSQFTVIAAFDPIRPNGGHFIDVVSVATTGAAVTVDVNSSGPEGGNATTVMTQPYHIIKIPKTTLPVAFE